ncbi:MAG: diguanylate cyclase, partial [Salinirussus sp.]
EGPGLDPNELVALERGKEASLIHLSGMGLWLVNWVVRDSGGYLKFEQSEQGGTLAIVGVPVCSSTSSLLRRR